MINKETLDLLATYNRINARTTADLEQNVVNASKARKIPPEDIEVGKHVLASRRTKDREACKAEVQASETLSAEAKVQFVAEIEATPWLIPFCRRDEGEAITGVGFVPMAKSRWGPWEPFQMPPQDLSVLPGYIPMPKPGQMREITKQFAERNMVSIQGNMNGAFPDLNESIYDTLCKHESPGHKAIARRNVEVTFSKLLWTQVVDFIGKLTPEQHAKLGEFFYQQVFWQGSSPKDAVGSVIKTIVSAFEGYPNTDAGKYRQAMLSHLGLCDYPEDFRY